ncbi:alanine racemase [candidate division WOR-3 bacterium]|nr:alanine racemase [candidate division WOR-3 bacterium]
MRASSLSIVEINSKNLADNIFLFKKILGRKTELSPVIKSNAYGHGFREIMNACIKNNVKTFCVSFIEEALLAREISPEARVICLGYVALKDISEAVRKDIELTVFNHQTIKKASLEAVRQDKKAKIHIKLETGTNRQGYPEKEALKAAELTKNLAGVDLVGISTHFANIEDTTEHEFAIRQIKVFEKITSKIKKLTLGSFQIHTACSAAAILFPKTYYDLARIGISLYGIWPSKETFISAKLSGKLIELKPVLSWKTIITQVKLVPPGSYVGYGCTFKTTNKTKLAYLPIGYYDGFDRSLSNAGWVLVRGKRAPVRGRVCMNVVIIDVTGIDGVKTEDEAVIIGKQGNESISAETVASLCGTINYEVLSRINPLIKRKVI